MGSVNASGRALQTCECGTEVGKGSMHDACDAPLSDRGRSATPLSARGPPAHTSDARVDHLEEIASNEHFEVPLPLPSPALRSVKCLRATAKSLAMEVRSEIDDAYLKHRTEMQQMLEVHLARMQSMMGSLDGEICPLRSVAQKESVVPVAMSPSSSEAPTYDVIDTIAPSFTAASRSSPAVTEQSEVSGPSLDTFRYHLRTFSNNEALRRNSAVKQHQELRCSRRRDRINSGGLGVTLAEQVGSSKEEPLEIVDDFSFAPVQGDASFVPVVEEKAATQSIARQLVTSKAFETCTALAIITNAAFIGVHVDLMATYRIEETPTAIIVGQIIYCVIFFFEILARATADWRSFWSGQDMRWNVLDVLIVGASVCEVVLEASSTATIIRMVRIVRLLRILRIIRTIRLYRSLRILVYSIFSTLKQLGWTLLLIFLIMYMFGIVFTQVTTEHLIATDADNNPNSFVDSKLEEAYGTLPRSIYTLFKTICGGVDWEGVANPLSDVHWSFVALFQIYVAFMFFAVLNVVVGVFCNSAIENAHKDQDAVVHEQLVKKDKLVAQFKQLFDNVESLNSSVITFKELERSLEQPKLVAFFEALDLEVSDAWTLFKLLDTHERHVIEIDVFVEGCLRLRGHAKSLDMARMMYENRWIMNKLVRVAAEVHSIHGKISLLQPRQPLHGVTSHKTVGATATAATARSSKSTRFVRIASDESFTLT